MNPKEISELFKVLGDETRIQILTLLTENDLCACKILEQFAITQPTLSFHMKKLCDCNLVISQKVGKWMHYSLNPEKINQLQLFLSTIKLSDSGCIQYGDC